MCSHITKLLQENNIEMCMYGGKPYDSHYPIQATNADEFAYGEKLVVQETLEPALVFAKLIQFPPVQGAVSARSACKAVIKAWFSVDVPMVTRILLARP